MMHGYVRCAATRCMASGTLIADVPLCAEHEALLSADLAARAAGQTAPVTPAVWPHVVYYAVRRDDPDLLKIGTSVQVRHRLSGLGKTTRPLRLLAAEPGSYDVEKKRHQQFFTYRVTGEWYRHDPALMEHMRSLRVEYPLWRQCSGMGRAT
jgi:Meiotically up-regulated gene 113